MPGSGTRREVGLLSTSAPLCKVSESVYGHARHASMRRGDGSLVGLILKVGLVIRPFFIVAMVALFFAGCDEQAKDEPYVDIVGGGFILNYRLAEAYYGFVAQIKRAPPEGTVLEARFEDPSGGPAIIVRQIHRAPRRGYKFETPPVKGVEADRDYAPVRRLEHPW